MTRRIRGTTRELDERARSLRACPTRTEALLWDRLRGRQVDGFKFQRQHALGRYILDFCCCEVRLVIELDGVTHAASRDHDRLRDRILNEHGYRVLRIANERVHSDLSRVIADIRAALHEPRN